MHIVGYVTRASSKRVLAQEVPERGGQASGEPEANIEPDISESQLNIKIPPHPTVDTTSSLLAKGELSVSRFAASAKKPSRKRKRSLPGQGTAPYRSKKLRTKEKFSGVTSKPTRLHLLKDDDLESRVACQDIKLISTKESVFGALSLELRTVLKILQKLDPLAQEAFCARSDNQPRSDKEPELSPAEPALVQDPDRSDFASVKRK